MSVPNPELRPSNFYDGYPGEINITEVPGVNNPDSIRDAADNFLQSRPHITNSIIQYGKDAVAMATSRGIKLYVGIGIASLAAIA